MISPILRWETVVSQPFDENTYIAWIDDSTDCVVIDPGLEPQKISGLFGKRKARAGRHSEYAWSQ